MSLDSAPKNTEELENLEGELENAYGTVQFVDDVFAGKRNREEFTLKELDILRSKALARIAKIEAIIGKHSVYGRS